MSDTPKTLLSLAGASFSHVDLGAAALVMIDCQNEYRDGALPLAGIDAAAAEAARAAAAVRAAGGKVIHVRHKGRAGGPFDLVHARGGYLAECAPAEGEAEVLKGLPNSFAGTGLQALLEEAKPGRLLVAGFMTHMCVSATARAALDLGFGPSVILAAATATRDLPGPDGGVVGADVLQRAELAALADRFAFVVRDIDAARAA